MTPEQSSHTQSKDGADPAPANAYDEKSGGENDFHSAFLEVARRRSADSREPARQTETAEGRESSGEGMNAEQGSESLRPHGTEEGDEQDADGSTPVKETKGAEENAVAALGLGKVTPEQGQGGDLGKHGGKEVNVKESQPDKPPSPVDPKVTREATAPLTRSGVKGGSEATNAGKSGREEKQETSFLRGMTAGAKGSDASQAGEKGESGHDASKTKGSEKQETSTLKGMTAEAKRNDASQAGEKGKPGHDAGKTKGSEKQETSTLKGMTADAKRGDTPRAQGGVESKPSEGRIRGEGVKQADQVSDKIGAKASGEEKREAVLARNGSFRDAVAASAADKERAANRTAEVSKRGESPKETPLKSQASDVRSARSAHEGKKSNSNRQEGRGSESREQHNTAMQGKRENEAFSVRLANNTPNRGGEPGFDRSMQKSEMNIQDNPPGNSTDSPSSPKVLASNAHPGEAAMVKRSFQESGVKHFVDKASLNLKNGQQEFKIELKPESLGQVRVQVSTENHQVTIRILTELPLAKEMIENNVQQLKADLQAQGLQIDKFDVSLSQNSNKNGEAQRFSDSRKSKKGGIQRKPSKDIDPADGTEQNGWMQNQASTAGAINLFA